MSFQIKNKTIGLQVNDDSIFSNKFDYIFLFIQFIYFSGLVKYFGTDLFLGINIVFTLLLCLKKKKISNRTVESLIIILVIFSVLSLLPIFKHGIDPQLFIGYLGRISLGILIIVYFRDVFFEYFENLMFLLSIISLLLFTIQIINIGFYDIFSGLSEFVLSEERLLYGRGILEGHRYFFIFLINSWAEYRNSGFMWEPAAFGAMLNWSIVFNLFINKFEFNLRFFIFLITAITTFSLGTIVYLIIIVFLLLIKQHKTKSLVLLSFGLLFIYILLPKLPFFQSNIEMITFKIEEEDRLKTEIQSGKSFERVSRVGAFYANINQLIQEPLGYGLNRDTEEKYGFSHAPNGLFKIIRNWGFLSAILIVVFILKIINCLEQRYRAKNNIVEKIIFSILIILPIIGNPFYNQPFLYSILLSGFFVNRNNLNG